MLKTKDSTGIVLYPWGEGRVVTAYIAVYNAITQNNCFVKGSHKYWYDIYFINKNKAHLNWPNKDRISILMQRNMI